MRRPEFTDYVNYGEDLYRPYRRQMRLQQRYDYIQQEEENPVYNLGGHWETRVGDTSSSSTTSKAAPFRALPD